MSYRFHELRDGNGDALATDAAGPDASTPETRIISLPALPPNGANAFVLHPLDGTSISVQFWVLEESSSTWVKIRSAAVVAAVASVPVVSVVSGIAIAAGSKVYAQITANTGVTRLGWRYG